MTTTGSLFAFLVLSVLGCWVLWAELQEEIVERVRGYEAGEDPGVGFALTGDYGWVLHCCSTTLAYSDCYVVLWLFVATTASLTKL
jgi:hypothetical protein